MSGANGTINRLPAAERGMANRILSLIGGEGGLASLQGEMDAGRRAMVELRYKAAQGSRYRQAGSSLGGAGDSHYAHGRDYTKIRELAREFDRDHPQVGVITDRACDNVLGDGLVVDPQTKSRTLNEDIRGDWEEWADDPNLCDWYGELTYSEMERLGLRHGWIDGDAFKILDDRSEMIRFEEPERCDSPQDLNSNTVHGIIRDDSGRLAGYSFVKDWKPGDRTRRQGSLAYRDLVAVDKKDVIHWHPGRRRATQSRGVSAYSPAFDQIAIYGNTEFALLVKHQVASCIAGFLETDFPVGVGGEDTETSKLDGSTVLKFGEFTPAMIAKLKRGEKFSGFNPGMQTSQDIEYLMMILRSIAVQIGQPLELALLTSKNQSFSAMRGVLEAAKIGWRCTQSYAKRIRSRVYKWRLALRIRAGRFGPRAERRKDIFNHQVIAPTWPYIEPKTDAEADSIRLEKCLASPRQIWAENGRDYDRGIIEIAEDRAAWIRACKAVADKLEKEGVEGVTWQQIAQATSSAAPAAVAAPEPAEDGDQDESSDDETGDAGGEDE